MIVLAALALSLLACQGATIFNPPNGHNGNHPATPFTVHFAKDLVPNTFQASLDGQDITNIFPPPALFDVGGGGGTILISTTTAPALEGRGPHKLVVYAESAGDTFHSSDEREFAAPHITFFPRELNLVETEWVQMEVQLPVAPPNPVVVTIIPNNVALSINGTIPGSPVQVTIPVTDRRATFRVKPILPTWVYLVGAASGCEKGSVSGFIRDRQ